MAGGVVTCALHVTASPEPLQLQLASSTSQVKIPAAVVTRPNQSSLTFQASVGAVAKPQSAIITATLGDMQVQESLLVVSTDRPVLVTPDKQIAKFGTPVNFTVGAADASGLPVQLEVKNLPAARLIRRRKWALCLDSPVRCKKAGTSSALRPQT